MFVSVRLLAMFGFLYLVAILKLNPKKILLIGSRGKSFVFLVIQNIFTNKNLIQENISQMKFFERKKKPSNGKTYLKLKLYTKIKSESN